ncbi:hypothetical protein [Providencia phage PSTCR7]|uniref:Uncharacterized protein n=1 Tax=Providencia phage PSTCR7 TaxID=2783549 RepID=A0A7S9SWC1_9CAUD|nr:hypothetical protein PQD10_gp20 [Providencia phage PSTCR7]QPI18472.1 hypothetical protein [Providencia phage PSTCR7]
MSKPVFVIQNDEHAMQQLAEWYRLADQLRSIKETEMALRTALSRYFFPNPKVGMNKHELPDGAILAMEHKLSYKVLPELMESVRKQCAEMQINIDDYIKSKPELKIKEYKTLTGEAKEVFGQLVEIKPASPTLKITL